MISSQMKQIRFLLTGALLLISNQNRGADLTLFGGRQMNSHLTLPAAVPTPPICGGSGSIGRSQYSFLSDGFAVIGMRVGNGTVGVGVAHISAQQPCDPHDI